jgi:endonuclease YncB( thermonuclease family)
MLYHAVEVDMPLIFSYHVRDVVSVYDGDTCKLDIDMGFFMRREVDVRVDGVDTPERNGASKSAGQVVQSYAEQWLRLNLGSLVLHSKELDKYGRVLGIIENIETKDTLTNFLLRMKLAHSYDGGTKQPWKAAEFATILAMPKVAL